MTLKEILKEINKGNDVIIHCDTQEKATKFLTICKQKGFKWRGGKELLTPYDGMAYKSCYIKATTI